MLGLIFSDLEFFRQRFYKLTLCRSEFCHSLPVLFNGPLSELTTGKGHKCRIQHSEFCQSAQSHCYRQQKNGHDRPPAPFGVIAQVVGNLWPRSLRFLHSSVHRGSACRELCQPRLNLKTCLQRGILFDLLPANTVHAIPCGNADLSRFTQY